MILITQSLKELQLVMSDYVGNVRNDIRLPTASRPALDLLWEETEQLYQKHISFSAIMELRNMITVGYLIVKGASFPKESRGLHYNTDYPHKGELVQNIVL
jgi:L-aspartate oxidase